LDPLNPLVAWKKRPSRRICNCCPRRGRSLIFSSGIGKIFGEERYEVATFDSVMDLWPWQTIEQWENADSVNSGSEVANTIQTKRPWELGTKFRYFALDKAKNSIRQHLRR
jgi:hypothetical protein